MAETLSVRPGLTAEGAAEQEAAIPALPGESLGGLGTVWCWGSRCCGHCPVPCRCWGARADQGWHGAPQQKSTGAAWALPPARQLPVKPTLLWLEKQERLFPANSLAGAILALDGLFSIRLDAGINLRMSLGRRLEKGWGRESEGNRICVCA